MARVSAALLASVVLGAQARPQPGVKLLDGRPTGVIELSIERIVDDFPYFGSAANRATPIPDLTEAVFESAFDVAYDEGGLFILTMHPHITGHRSRGAALEKMVLHIKSKPAELGIILTSSRAASLS